MIVTTLGDKISSKIQSLQDDIDAEKTESDTLRSIMFKVATQLRIKDPVAFAAEIEMLESPARGCDGTGCLTAIALKDQVSQLEQQLYEHESVIFTLSSQLGIDPFDDGLGDGCCPRVIPHNE